MQYTVKIDEKKRTITVTLFDGTKGVARCNPSDRFDINTGIELALERAKVAKATAIKEKESKLKNPPPSIIELIKALEKALPVGQMVVVGSGDKLTNTQKAWLRSLAGGCDCKCHEVDEDEIYERGYDDGYDKGYAEAESEYDEIYERGYDKGYADGYAEAERATAEDIDNEVALGRIRDALADAGII